MPPQDTQAAPHATQDDAAPRNSAPATTAVSDAGGGSASPVAALVDALAFTLTIGQARDLFAAQARKIPAERTLQQYCIEGKIAAEKISTTSGKEWLINEASLAAFIAQQPQLTVAREAPHAAQDDAAPLNSAPATTAVSDAGGAGAATGAALEMAAVFSDRFVYEHPYVQRLEAQIDKLETKYDEQVRRTEEIQLKANERLIELQRMTTIGQSKTLADFMLQAKNWMTGGEPQDDINQPRL